MARKPSPVASRQTNKPAADEFWQKSPDEDETDEIIEIQPKTKRTYHLPDTTPQLLMKIQLKRYLDTGKKTDYSDLVSEAVEYLAAAEEVK